ncbi:class I SAM-dependent methyltransferase [Patescibacteria group bacterium]|nr:class I SAM-dependent methyltransferase [Patescibacteria group bacterium]
MKHKYFYPALSKLKGRILEIGFGDGESLVYYSSDCGVFALEKSDKKIQTKKNSRVKYKNVKFFKGKAESLPFEDAFFDGVVVSFTLCSVSSIDISMNEIVRVLKPGGKFILLEHVRSEKKIIAKLQDIFAKPYSWIAKNCHPNRNPLLFINKDIFELSIEVKNSYILGNLVFVKAYKKLGVCGEQQSI